MTAEMPIALIAGANRGIGLEICRQLARHGYTVILGTRDLAKGRQAAGELGHGSGQVNPQQLDVTDTHSIERLRVEVEAESGRLDVLWSTTQPFCMIPGKRRSMQTWASSWKHSKPIRLVRGECVRRFYHCSGAAHTGGSSTYQARLDHWHTWTAAHQRIAYRKPRSMP